MTTDILSKTCNCCKELKPITDFKYHARKKFGGYEAQCRECLNEKARIRWRKRKSPENSRVQHLWNRYQMRPHEYDELHEQQNGVCAICGGVQTYNRRLAVDHCHTTGLIRGLLCDGCNVGIGGLGESVQTLTNAIAYLQKHEERPAPQPKKERLPVLSGTEHHWFGRNAQGDANPCARLSEEQVREIFRRYHAKEASYSKLGKEYGVGATTISNIASGRSWRHIHEQKESDK